MLIKYFDCTTKTTPLKGKRSYEINSTLLLVSVNKSITRWLWEQVLDYSERSNQELLFAYPKMSFQFLPNAPTVDILLTLQIMTTSNVDYTSKVEGCVGGVSRKKANIFDGNLIWPASDDFLWMFTMLPDWKLPGFPQTNIARQDIHSAKRIDKNKLREIIADFLQCIKICS